MINKKIEKRLGKTIAILVYMSITILLLIFMFTNFISFNLGLMYGSITQEQTLLDQLYIRDYNISNRMCLHNDVTDNKTQIAYCKEINCRDFLLADCDNCLQKTAVDYTIRQMLGKSENNTAWIDVTNPINEV